MQGFNAKIELLDGKKGDIDQHSVDKGNGYAPKEKAKTADEVADEYFPDDNMNGINDCPF